MIIHQKWPDAPRTHHSMRDKANVVKHQKSDYHCETVQMKEQALDSLICWEAVLA